MHFIVIDGEESTRQLFQIDHDSNGKHMAVGYWHTHPRKSQTPSWKDNYSMWEDPYSFPSDPLLLILGGRFDILDLSVTIYQRMSYDSVRLHLDGHGDPLTKLSNRK